MKSIIEREATFENNSDMEEKIEYTFPKISWFITLNLIAYVQLMTLFTD